MAQERLDNLGPDDIIVSNLSAEEFLASMPVVSPRAVADRDAQLVGQLEVSAMRGDTFFWQRTVGRFVKRPDGTEQHELRNIEVTDDPEGINKMVHAVVGNLRLGIHRTSLREPGPQPHDSK